MKYSFSTKRLSHDVIPSYIILVSYYHRKFGLIILDIHLWCFSHRELIIQIIGKDTFTLVLKAHLSSCISGVIQLDIFLKILFLFPPILRLLQYSIRRFIKPLPCFSCLPKACIGSRPIFKPLENILYRHFPFQDCKS